ncbi:hypothetical protein [Microbispora sp. NPDC049633]|uniref:hypothetical protein n=1 Tax=Microbispora sp. NPDC049633 TaxID=3154355 RepID=UPI003444E7B8
MNAGRAKDGRIEVVAIRGDGQPYCIRLAATLITSIALSVGVVWLLTLIRDWLLGQVAIVPFDPHW